MNITIDVWERRHSLGIIGLDRYKYWHRWRWWMYVLPPKPERKLRERKPLRRRRQGWRK